MEMPKPIPISKPILISEPIPIPELKPEPILEPIAETDSGPTIRNRVQKTSELARIDSDENFIFPITTMTCPGSSTVRMQVSYISWPPLGVKRHLKFASSIQKSFARILKLLNIFEIIFHNPTTGPSIFKNLY